VILIKGLKDNVSVVNKHIVSRKSEFWQGDWGRI